MSKNTSIQLEKESINEIAKVTPTKKFILNSHLFYEGQIPIVAYLLVEGCIKLMKNKKIKKILKPGSLVGLKELMNNSPSKLSAQVQADSTLCFLDKSTIQEMIQHEGNAISDLLRVHE
jgi:CRP-like cAMP-binding protein